MAEIYPGFIGVAIINNSIGDYPPARCTEFSVNVKQEPLFYDHIIGLRDTIPTSIYDIKGDEDDYGEGPSNLQKILWRPGVKICQGGFSFPWTDDNLGLLWKEAITGASFDMNFQYACDLAREFTGCKVNSFNFKVASGDIVSSTLDIMAIHEDMADYSKETIDTPAKILTWDSVSITSDVIDSVDIVNFDFTINNNCMPIYTAGNNVGNSDTGSGDPLEAKEIRVGMQQLTGSISFYNLDSLAYLDDISSPTSINVNVGGFSFELTVVFKPMEQSASVGPVIRVLPFVGVDHNIAI